MLYPDLAYSIYDYLHYDTFGAAALARHNHLSRENMKKILSIVGVAVVLAACGGGGDDAPPPNAAQGFWSGQASTGTTVSVAILENGETWGVYSSGSVILGALYGQTTASGGTLNGSGSEFDIAARSVASGTYQGTYSPKSTLAVRTSLGSVFTGSYNADYDNPASLAAVAGSFSGTGVSASSPVQSPSVSISAAGAITVPPSLGCSASGTASPRPSGKNVFNVTVTFSGTSCALGNGGTASGIAYYNTATRELLVLALNSAKTDGFIYVGTKSPA